IANHHRHQSLRLYNVALHTFRKRMKNSNRTTSRWMALMTPLLAMYELLQGDFEAADKLLSSAMEALRSSGDISHISTSESSDLITAVNEVASFDEGYYGNMPHDLSSMDNDYGLMN
uniref:Uncharacterized protein n=1 Tax=Fusarium oxysporum (strain Fo5176) TaxID=660025 RepID=A0A0D2XJ79_FUSOF